MNTVECAFDNYRSSTLLCTTDYCEKGWKYKKTSDEVQSGFRNGKVKRKFGQWNLNKKQKGRMAEDKKK